MKSDTSKDDSVADTVKDKESPKDDNEKFPPTSDKYVGGKLDQKEKKEDKSKEPSGNKDKDTYDNYNKHLSKENEGNDVASEEEYKEFLAKGDIKFSSTGHVKIVDKDTKSLRFKVFF